MRLYWRKARFYLDDSHDFVIEMAGLKYARIKVLKKRKKLILNINAYIDLFILIHFGKIKIQVIHLNLSMNGFISEPASPEPNACAKVSYAQSIKRYSFDYGYLF